MSLRWNWDSPTPSAASECALPPVPKGGGAHSPTAKGVGESQFQRLEKRLALCLLCVFPLPSTPTSPPSQPFHSTSSKRPRLQSHVLHKINMVLQRIRNHPPPPPPLAKYVRVLSPFTHIHVENILWILNPVCFISENWKPCRRQFTWTMCTRH